jgi:hypothetical protein
VRARRDVADDQFRSNRDLRCGGARANLARLTAEPTTDTDLAKSRTKKPVNPELEKSMRLQGEPCRGTRNTKPTSAAEVSTQRDTHGGRQGHHDLRSGAASARRQAHLRSGTVHEPDASRKRFTDQPDTRRRIRQKNANPGGEASGVLFCSRFPAEFANRLLRRRTRGQPVP